MLKFEVPCSVIADDTDGKRVKLNVDPGSKGAQIVLMHLTPEQAAEFRQGRRYVVTVEEQT